ncbi:uncharacterized protein LOC119766453 [Culex quinquefasciatus]|uniref:uncharacterized protein LOC119766453 n=1 Tax=Culex quinquefasciatus TaxID=7176 RepID=UPI0018E2BF98|nr:uncharacterized protein LOC119766453 [Culex quinquefasciatus]
MVYQVTRKRGRITKEAHCEIFSVDTVTGLWCPGRTFATCRRRCAKRYFIRTASVSSSPSSCRYTNINNRLDQYGLKKKFSAHLKEKFKPLAEAAFIEEELQRYH